MFMKKKKKLPVKMKENTVIDLGLESQSGACLLNFLLLERITTKYICILGCFVTSSACGTVSAAGHVNPQRLKPAWHPASDLTGTQQSVYVQYVAPSCSLWKLSPVTLPWGSDCGTHTSSSLLHCIHNQIQINVLNRKTKQKSNYSHLRVWIVWFGGIYATRSIKVGINKTIMKQ